MKKEYPKVPNHYNDDVITPALFNVEDLVLLEKLDGSNARIMLYDERYESVYGDEVQSLGPDDGDVLVGSKGRVRGVLADPSESFDGNFGRLLTHLRDNLDCDALRACHDEYDSPLLLFGEHMVKHTLDYGYDSSPPPAFLGFDVFVMRTYTPPPANPFDEDFSGFLPVDAAWDVFDRVGLDTVAIADQNATGFDPDECTVPLSEHGAIRAEGVVLRSDRRDERAKYVTAEFRERMHEAWGLREDEAESGAELFTARYLPNARLRKQVNKLVHRDDADAVTPETVANAAIADAWEEELADIQTLSIGLTPTDIYPRAHSRAAEVIKTMRTNARLNETSLDQLWADHGDPIEDPTLGSLAPDEAALDALTATLQESDDVERTFVRELCPADDIHTTAERIAAEYDRDIGRWVISDTHAALVDDIWYEHLDCIANLSVELVPSDIGDELLDYVADELDARADVDTTEKPDDWRQNPDDANPDGLGEMF